MAEAEQPERLRPDRRVTVDDVRQLMGSSTPHFALQLRNRIRKLIAPLPADDPARRLGEAEIARLGRPRYAPGARGVWAQPPSQTRGRRQTAPRYRRAAPRPRPTPLRHRRPGP